MHGGFSRHLVAKSLSRPDLNQVASQVLLGVPLAAASLVLLADIAKEHSFFQPAEELLRCSHSCGCPMFGLTARIMADTVLLLCIFLCTRHIKSMSSRPVNVVRAALSARLKPVCARQACALEPHHVSHVLNLMHLLELQQRWQEALDLGEEYCLPYQ